MPLDKEKELQIAEYFLKSFEEKTPFDYDILDSMVNELKPEIHKIQKTDS
jgi:bifunctional DNase/RNase